MSGFTDGHDLPDEHDSSYRDVLVSLTGSARRAGRRAVLSGRWLADTVVDLAPRLPVRDLDTLSKHHGGRTGTALARSMIRSSGRVSAAIGATAGGLIAFQEVSIAGLLAVPFELAAETALVVLLEIKLVAELHEVAGRPLPGGVRERVAAAVRSWLSGRGVSAVGLVTAPGGPGDAPAGASRARAARRQGRQERETALAFGTEDVLRSHLPGTMLLGRTTRHKLTMALRQRFTRNLTTLGPMLTGSAVAGYLNRKATLDVGRRLADDLGLGRAAARRALAEDAEART